MLIRKNIKQNKDLSQMHDYYNGLSAKQVDAELEGVNDADEQEEQKDNNEDEAQNDNQAAK